MRTRFALNGLNFFTAAVQAGFGPFIAVWLTQQGWSSAALGSALSIGTLAGLLGQVPGGLLVDHFHTKRYVAAGAMMVTGLAAIAVSLFPSVHVVWGAEVGNTLASCVMTPAIAALTLSIYGHDGFGERLGHNTRYAALGNVASAFLLGAAASYISDRAVFLITAALALPAVVALFMIRGSDRIDDDHPALKHPKEREHWPWQTFGEPVLHVFTIAVVLFQLGNAALLPLALNNLTHRQEASGFLVSATIIVPQVITATIAPWAGKLAQRIGRRPVLIVGFAAVPIRGLLFAILPGALPLAMFQALDSISAAVFGLMLPLIAADLTRRTGYLNLAIGWFGLASGLGATFSTVLAGWIADNFGPRVMFLFLAGAGLLPRRCFGSRCRKPARHRTDRPRNRGGAMRRRQPFQSDPPLLVPARQGLMPHPMHGVRQEVRRRHPRWSFHFTPTSVSWLNAVEGFLAKLTKKRFQRGVFCSVVELQAAIARFLAQTNTDPRPFRWTRDPHKIIAAVKRGTKCYILSTRISAGFRAKSGVHDLKSAQNSATRGQT